MTAPQSDLAAHSAESAAQRLAHEIALAVRQELVERRDQERDVDEERQERRGIRR